MLGTVPVACRFYLVGKCSKSSECRFMHDKSAPVNLFCTKFASGKCPYEKRCRYIHENPIPSIEIQSRPKLCRSYYELGICRKRWDCPDIHGYLCSGCALFAIMPDDVDGEKHRETCKLEMEKMCRRYSSESISKCCSICQLPVVENSQRFGILESCNHVFCTVCIKKWRTVEDQPRETTKGCPVCRVVSSMLIPSDYWMDDPVEKKIFIEDYKKKVSKKLCRYLMNGQAKCPFGINCLYSHEINGVEICREKPGFNRIRSRK